MGDKVHPVTPNSDLNTSEEISTDHTMADRVHPVTINSDHYEDILSPSSLADRFRPTAPPAPFEPLSPSGRSDATGYSQATSNFQPLKAYTAPGYLSPPRPPPTVVGRPPLRSPAHKRGRNACFCCLIVFLSIFLLLVLAVGTAALVLWLVYHPKIPHYSVEDAQIIKLKVASGNGDSSNVGQPIQNPILNTDILLTIQAQNPNHKIGISYSQISIDGTYQGASVGQCNIPGFYQAVDNTTTLSARLNVTNSQLTGSQGTAMQTDISNNDIGLLGRVDVKVGLKIGSWTTPHVWIHVECNIQVSPPTSPQGGKLLSKSCHWKWK
jgi:hypothetical protein